MQLEISKIRLDGGTQPRAALNEETILDYRERMEVGDPFPKVTDYFDGTDYWLADGYHRISAAKRLRHVEIEADVQQGTLSDAQWYSYSVNKSHGLRRTNKDKIRAVHAALLHPRSKDMSDAAVAEHVGVHQDTVLRHRHKISADLPGNGKWSESQGGKAVTTTKRDCKSPKRTGRDGRTINTTHIGKSKLKSSKSNKHRKIARNANMPKLGLSKPMRIIQLQFYPDNPHTAAATLIQMFSREFLETIVYELSAHLNKEGAIQ